MEEHRHPNPAKAREGKRKHRLILDPLRAPVVLMIFEDYCLRRLGLGEIINKLNSDLARYPPPAVNPTDEMALEKTWSRSQLRAMLRNPKYTGYNVWGRHDKRPGRPASGRVSNGSGAPRQATPRSSRRSYSNKSRSVPAGPTSTPPRKHRLPTRTRRTRRAGRVYVLRGRVRCSLCGRRMEGTHQKGSNYYRCRVNANRGISAARGAGHPGALQIKEETVLEAVLEFMDRRLFGPERLRAPPRRTRPRERAIKTTSRAKSSASPGPS